MASGHENSEDPVTSVSEEMIYVAVGTDVKDCKSILLWALRNFGGKRICIVHVHRPARWIPNGCKSEKIMCVAIWALTFMRKDPHTELCLIMYIIFLEN